MSALKTVKVTDLVFISRLMALLAFNIDVVGTYATWYSFSTRNIPTAIFISISPVQIIISY